MVDMVRIRRSSPDLWLIGPPGAPSTADSDPGVDTAVLEVAGGHLTWSLTAGQRVPAATLHDLGTAQEWLWALYGAEVALAADAYTEPVDSVVRPGNLDLASAVRRLAYAHWAAHWWPASTVDDIAALDPALLDSEIAELTESCESVVDGADSAPVTGVEEFSAGRTGDRDIGGDTGAREWATARADEYALAAGPNPSTRGTDLVLERGTGGWDWRYCPAGVVDASERAVSWELFRAAGSTVVRVRAVAAAGVPADLPGYLRPHALIHTPAGFLDIALELSGDAWSGEVAEPADSVRDIEIYVPGVGPSAPAGAVAHRIPDAAADAEQRRRVRELARNRLRLAATWSGAVSPGPAAGHPATGESGDSAASPTVESLDYIAPLQSEIAAAVEDSDF